MRVRQFVHHLAISSICLRQLIRFKISGVSYGNSGAGTLLPIDGDGVVTPHYGRAFLSSSQDVYRY